MGEGGADIKFNTAIAAVRFPYSVECKNQEKQAVYGAFTQAQNHYPDLEPVVFLKANNKPVLAVITFEHFMELIECRESQKNCQN